MRSADLAAFGGLWGARANMGDIVTFKSAAAARSGRVGVPTPAKILLFIGVQYCRAAGSDGGGRSARDAGPPEHRPPQRPPKKRA
jgi:hypothetical protein